MDVNSIEDVLNLSTILSSNGAEDAAHQPYLIAALIEWRDSSAPSPLPADVYPDSGTTAKAAPKAKRGKATEPDDSVPSDGFTTPDPSEPEF